MLRGFFRCFWLRAPVAQGVFGGVSLVCKQFATLSVHESGVGAPSPVIERLCDPLCAWVR